MRTTVVAGETHFLVEGMGSEVKDTRLAVNAVLKVCQLDPSQTHKSLKRSIPWQGIEGLRLVCDLRSLCGNC